MALPTTSQDPLTIASLYDFSAFPWSKELIDFTVSLINDHTNGWFDDVLPDAQLQYSIFDAACDQHVAVRAYLNLTRDGNRPTAILGCRCSSPTLAISTLSSAENIPVLSPSATSPKLSDKEDYATASRLVAPDNASGQVGALVSLLKEFGWQRISIIKTQTDYGEDFEVELTRAWQEEGVGGEIGPSGTVQVMDSKQLDPKSVKHVLENWPEDNPSVKSRIVVLLAHHHHAFDILKIAQEMNFQPDTIYVGVDAWTARTPKDMDASWMPDIPGYIGMIPHRDPTSPVYADFVRRLEEEQSSRGLDVATIFQDWRAFTTVDSVMALAMALSNVSPEARSNGEAVVDALRSLKFEGISGPVEFNEKGDLANPKYTVMTLPKKGTEFVSVGTAEPGSVNIDLSKICYPQVGCGVPPPSDKYPVPSEIWTAGVVGLAVLGLVVAILIPTAYRFHRQRLPLKKKLKLLEEEIEGLDSNDGAVRKRKGSLYKEIARLLDQPRPSSWTDDQGLVSVAPTEKEYWAVLDKMRETSSEPVWISELSRVQNDGLYAYYVFRKNQLASKYGVDLNEPDAVCEIDAWHGTSSLNPDVIYNDNHDGFMMQYSQQGLYGRGLYFSERFDYSDCYSYRVNGARLPNGSMRQEGEDREIFLVKLLVGQAVTMNHVENEEECRRLVTAPENPATNGLRYDTVSGLAVDQTKIHAVYENGRAFPSYLIRYYKGQRDPLRTPFEKQADVITDSKMDTTQTTTSSDNENSSDSVPLVVGDADEQRNDPQDNAHINPPLAGDLEQGVSESLWMYEGDGGEQLPFSTELQAELEQAYQADPRSSFTVQNDLWTYDVDLNSMTQTNRDHPAHRRRSISRMELR